MQHLGEEQVFDFAPKSDDASVLQWAAWYGDCLHEVEEVTSGTRVAVSYSVLCAGPPEVDSDDEEEAPAEKVAVRGRLVTAVNTTDPCPSCSPPSRRC